MDRRHFEALPQPTVRLRQSAPDSIFVDPVLRAARYRRVHPDEHSAVSPEAASKREAPSLRAESVASSNLGPDGRDESLRCTNPLAQKIRSEWPRSPH